MKVSAVTRSLVFGGSAVAALLLIDCTGSETPSFGPGPSGAGAGAGARAGAGALAGAAGSIGVSLAGSGGSAGDTSTGLGGGGASSGASSAAGASNGGGGAVNTAAGAAGSGDVAGGAAGAAGAGAAGGGSAYNPCPTSGAACRIMPLGDSITWGVGSTDGGGYRDELFKKALAASAKLTFVGSGQSGPQTLNGQTFPRSNEGHSGWTIDDGIGSDGSSRSGLYPKISGWLASTPPDIILLMIGTNDINVQVDVANAPKRLGLLIDRIIQGSPNALLVVAQIVPTTTDATNTRVQAYNAAIPALIDERKTAGKHVLLVDMYGAFTSNAAYKTALMNDGLHPNDAGHAVLAGVWWNAVSALLPR